MSSSSDSNHSNATTATTAVPPPPHQNDRQQSDEMMMYPRMSFTFDDFMLRFHHVDELTLQDRTRASLLMEKWVYEYYSDPNPTRTDLAVPEMPNLFIIISQDGQQVTGDANVVSFDAYLSFGANRTSSNTSYYDPRDILAKPFVDFEANAKYVRSLKLDMQSFRNVDLLLDPPVFGPVAPATMVIAAPEESSTQTATTTTTNMVQPSANNAGKLPAWATVLGSTAVALIILFLVGTFVFLVVRLARSRLRSTKLKGDDDDADEVEVQSILASASKTPNSNAPVSGTPLGTICEEDDPTFETLSVSAGEEAGFGIK
jgi:hypothetical protein